MKDLGTRVRGVVQHLRGGALSPWRAGLSVAVGLFIGCLPLYGLHLPLCVLVCLPLRLDVLVAYVAANISNPFFAPFLVAAEIEIGALLLTGERVRVVPEELTLSSLGGYFVYALLGSLVVGSGLALVGGTVSAWAARRFRGRADSEHHLDVAVARTVARYARAPRGDRMYVAMKLETDEMTRQLVALPGDFGRVVDAGCGRGQMGLLLLELKRAESVSGFDVDQRKVAVAQTAAQTLVPQTAVPVTRYWDSDLRTATWPAADTVLFLDVLHYVSPADQREVLVRATSQLSAGGRLIVREVDAAARGSRLTRALERCARACGYNRGQGLWFRPLAEFKDELLQLGFVCEHTAAEASHLSNVLLVAHKGGRSAAHRTGD